MAGIILKCNVKESITKMKKAFLAGVESVQPQKLIGSYLKQENNKLVINNNTHELQKNVYVIGYGKAVAGMIDPVVSQLTTPDSVSHLQQGIISVPHGFQKVFGDKTYNSNIQVLEGAKDNIPDEAAFMTAKKIVNLLESLEKHHLLLVLISGGGSALLPYPLPPLTLEEKIKLIKDVSRAGASITELNTLRKALSFTKGGRLAQLTDAKIVSFILSDIINSPLDMIASGTTVLNQDSPDAALKVLDKYNVSAPQNVKTLLQRTESSTSDFAHVTNLIIGNNETALLGAKTSISQLTGGHCIPLILSSSLQGEASIVGKKLADLAVTIINLFTGHDQGLPESLLVELCIDEVKKSDFLKTISECRDSGCSVCLIFGGETTVTVSGLGRGGRNQEMILSASISLEKKLQNCVFSGDVILLSGGTDGIDGPTDAAGAITYWSHHDNTTQSQIGEARQQGLSPELFLTTNDSYTYFSQLTSSQYLLNTGHTGTNVMDLQMLFISPS